MNIDWETMMFVGIWLGLFVGLPICLFFVLRYFFSGRTRKVIINVAACGGLVLALFMVLNPFMSQPTDPGPGNLAILILIPLGVLLGAVCGGLMWLNNRSQ